jgi:hypothetical protein
MSNTSVPPLERDVPRYLLVFAWLTPLLVFAQFLMAGLSLFQNGAIWRCHAIAGFVLAGSIGVLAAAAIMKRVHGVTVLLSLLVVSYIVQIALIVATKEAGMAIWQALHPFNGSLMLALSLVIAGKLTWGWTFSARLAAKPDFN